MALASTAKLLAELGLVDKLTPGLKKAGAGLNTFESRLGKVGGGLGKVSSGLARAGTVVAGAAVTGLGAAAAAAIDFEDAFAGVKKTVDETDLRNAGLSFDELARSFRDMATEIPITATEFARIGETAGALGIKAADIEEFTKTVALLGVTTNVSADDAATALGQLSNVLGLTGDDFDNFGAALVDLGNKGASTESDILEIARRAGGSAKLIGVAKDATLGWSAAIANLGLQPELAGTALQKFFLQSQSIVTNGRKPLERMAEIAGKSAKDFAKAFKKDAGGALETFIQGLGKLPKDQRLKAVQKLFGKGSGLTRAIIGLADSYDRNLAPSIDTASTAWEQNAALTAEAQKRFDTIRSKIQLLKNNLIEGAITLGEGFAPAIGRAAEKLSAFLKADENRSALKSLGEDIGKAIDGIDWKDVLDGAKDFVGVMKVALDYAKKIFDAVNALPTEIKAAGLGFLALNKVSGGLIGSGISDIVGSVGGGIARGAAGRLPGIGKLVAQPVIVTNWPPGFGAGGGGGVAGAVGGGSKLTRAAGGALGAVAIVGSALSVLETQQAVSEQNTAYSSEIKGTLDTMLSQNPTRAQMQSSLGAVEQGIADIRSNPLLTLVQGDALTNLETMRDTLKTQLGATSTGDKAQVAGLREARVAIAEKVAAGATTTANAARNAGDRTVAASAGVASAVRNSRPIVSVKVDVGIAATTVIKKYTRISRHGPTGGSRDGRGASGPTERDV